MNNSDNYIYLVVGICSFIMLFLFIIVYKPTSRYKRGKYLQRIKVSKA